MHPNSSFSAKPVGLLVVGRKRPGFDQEWNQRMVRAAQSALAEAGLQIVGLDQAVPDDKSVIAAVEKIRAAGCGTLFVLQPSLGNGQLAFTLMQHWDRPVVLWATPERADSDIVSSCSLVAQHLWASLFRQSDRPFEFLYGDPAGPAVRQSLTQAASITQIPSELAQTKIGLVGSQAPGFVAMHADPFLLAQALGVQLANQSLPMFMERVRGIDENRVAEDVRKVQEFQWPMNGVSEGDLPLSSRYYLAMRDLIDEEELTALAIQCWPEFGNMLGQWPYLALTRLNADGIVASMEGDVDGAITCLIGKSLRAGAGFITDWLEHDRDTIHFWHPGVAPLEMCDKPTLAKHFNIAKPMVVDGPLKTDLPVTIARLWRCDGKYHLTAFEGRTIKPRRSVTGNAALVKTDIDVPAWFDAALHAGLPHHVVAFAGHHADSFRRVARVLKTHWFAV
jgi:L-fucose isomerase-like protein